MHLMCSDSSANASLFSSCQYEKYIEWKAKSIQMAASINTQTSMQTAIPLTITIFILNTLLFLYNIMNYFKHLHRLSQ